ncbi:Hypothetical predicted protein [Pelobates cultripes]|uniref:Uncharacterized protein n=1 Tax=Pelobates cultripes TaxID=61616 RepID=A0AAD1VVE0_PELCU|nr:Hypothetical predicted protein [Pelobates cultripes]
MAMYGWFRLPAPPSCSTEVNKDVNVRFQNGPYRQGFLNVLRNKSPYHFEGHTLMFYLDQSRATLNWRRSLRPLAAELIRNNVPYKWDNPKCLLLPRDTENLKVQEILDITNTLQQLMLTTSHRGTLPATQEPQSPLGIQLRFTHSWQFCIGSYLLNN